MENSTITNQIPELARASKYMTKSLFQQDHEQIVAKDADSHKVSQLIQPLNTK